MSGERIDNRGSRYNFCSRSIFSPRTPRPLKTRLESYETTSGRSDGMGEVDSRRKGTGENRKIEIEDNLFFANELCSGTPFFLPSFLLFSFYGDNHLATNPLYSRC